MSLALRQRQTKKERMGRKGQKKKIQKEKASSGLCWNLHLLFLWLFGAIPANVEDFFIFLQALYWHRHIIIRRYDL